MASYPTTPHLEVISVTPLNSMPYVNPRLSYDDNNVSQIQEEKEPVSSAKPALIFLPCQPPEEEWNSLLSITKGGIGLTGSAASGSSGPVLGKMDIGESEDSYIFRVSLPGVAREDFICDCDPSGKILISGVTTTGEKIVYKNSLKFEMQSQHLCPPEQNPREQKLRRDLIGFQVQIKMASYNNRPICFLMIFHVIFLTTSVVLSRNDDETNLLQGLNSYRSSIKIPPLTKNKQATCLATELADDEFRNRECVATKAENAIPANSGSQFAGYGKLLKKCHILPNTTAEGIILPVCVKKLIPELILTNYTRTGYAKYVNDSRFTGAGVGSDDDWVVLILSTSAPGGSLASHAITLACCNNFILCFVPLMMLGFFML